MWTGIRTECGEGSVLSAGCFTDLIERTLDTSWIDVMGRVRSGWSYGGGAGVSILQRRSEVEPALAGGPFTLVVMGAGAAWSHLGFEYKIPLDLLCQSQDVPLCLIARSNADAAVHIGVGADMISTGSYAQLYFAPLNLNGKWGSHVIRFPAGQLKPRTVGDAVTFSVFFAAGSECEFQFFIGDQAGEGIPQTVRRVQWADLSAAGRDALWAEPEQHAAHDGWTAASVPDDAERWSDRPPDAGPPEAQVVFPTLGVAVNPSGRPDDASDAGHLPGPVETRGFNLLASPEAQAPQEDDPSAANADAIEYGALSARLGQLEAQVEALQDALSRTSAEESLSPDEPVIDAQRRF